MAKFPSLQTVLEATQKTIQRFPLESITAFIGTICSILLLQKEYKESVDVLTKTIMSCSLCLVLFLSASLYFEASKKSQIVRFLISILLGSFTTAFVFSFKKDITSVEFQQYFVLNIAFHLLVSFAGFIPIKYNQSAFWEFNKQLFLRILTAGLYSVVLYSGLALAILSIKELFNFEFDEKIYGYLFFVIAGVFNTLFFLNAVPETNNPEKPLTLTYPNGLKKFTQYVLIPLISLYLVILISYEAKILFTFSLPVGWVSYLVLIFAIFGILSFLLVHPIATATGNLWMKTFNRWFYFLLIPLIGLLFWAILYRVQLYGFTHERYYVLLLSIWLTIVVLYFLIQKHPKIKFIPFSLCILGLLSIIGPQSADSISKNSQLSRFENYMVNFKDKKLTFEQEKDLSSIVDFLEKNYTVSVLLPASNGKLDKLVKKNKKPYSFEIVEALGYEHRRQYEDNKGSNFYYNYYSNNENTIQMIQGYDFAFPISNYGDLKPTNAIKINNQIYKITSRKKDYGIDLQINKVNIPLRIYEFINGNNGFNNDNNSEKIIQKIETPQYIIKLTYRSASGKKQNDKKVVDEFQIDVLVDVKNIH